MPNKNLTTFYIVRHGESEWNVQKRIQGHTIDIPLTEKGKSQAKETAGALKHITFDLAFTSDLLRTQQTAEIIALEHKLAVTSVKALRERNYGRFQGKTYDELKRYVEKLTDEELKQNKIAPDVESDEALISRMITFLRETALAYPQKTVLVVTHGGIMRRLLMHLGFAKAEELMRGAVTNNAIVKLTSDGVDFFIEETQGVHLNTLGDGAE